LNKNKNIFTSFYPFQLHFDLTTNMSSFFAQIMEPGGGLMLLPFVRVVIGCLLVLTATTGILGVARIHMIILTFLSGGLLASLYFFESEFKKAKGNASRRGGPIKKDGDAMNKTD
jgi:hypothetical protein